MKGGTCGLYIHSTQPTDYLHLGFSSSWCCPIVGSKRNKSKQHEPNEINGQPVLCNRNGVDSGKMDRFSALLSYIKGNKHAGTT